MIQENLFAEIGSMCPTCSLGDTGTSADIFDRYNLPRERIDENGVRRCRHHDLPIAQSAAPCRECWREGAEGEVRHA
jgi:hypothetical protein